MLQALRPEDALAIAEISRRRTRDEQAMVQYLGIGRGARANTALPDGTLLRLPGDVDLAAFDSEERRRLEAEIARLSPEARRELIALIWLVQRPSSVSGVDVLLVGPSDLSIELGVPLDYQCDLYQRALDKIAATAAKRGVVAAMYFIPPGMDPNFFVEKGFKFFTMPWAPWATAGIQDALSGIKR